MKESLLFNVSLVVSESELVAPQTAHAAECARSSQSSILHRLGVARAAGKCGRLRERTTQCTGN